MEKLPSRENQEYQNLEPVNLGLNALANKPLTASKRNPESFLSGHRLHVKRWNASVLQKVAPLFELSPLSTSLRPIGGGKLTKNV